ncbi:hypothetical protein Tco_0324528 [Tanacetum coccineum]
MEAFIGGLPQSIEGNVTASKPQTLEEATNIAQRLMDQILKYNSVQEENDRKRKFEDRRNTINSNNYANNSYNGDYPNNLDNRNHPNNHNDNRNHDHHPQQNGRQETLRTYAVSPTKYTRPPKKYLGIPPLCTRCTLHHIGPCTIKCQNCNKIGHLTRNTFEDKMFSYYHNPEAIREEEEKAGEVAVTTETEVAIKKSD